MFRQVVGTILRLAVKHEGHWLDIKGSHDVPAYGFERIIDPPPLNVNTLRLLSEFHTGSMTLSELWGSMLAPETLETVMELAADAGRIGNTARTKLGIGEDVGVGHGDHPGYGRGRERIPVPGRRLVAGIYDLVVTARNPKHPLETLVAALVPIYFGRVGSFVIENRNVTTEEAEDPVWSARPARSSARSRTS